MKRTAALLVFWIFCLALVTVAVLETTFLFGPQRALASFVPPLEVGLKSGDLSANINGQQGFLGRLHDGTRFRTNNGEWYEFTKESPRLVTPGAILLEARADELVEGANRVEVVFTSLLGFERQLDVEFEYRPEAISEPISWDWSVAMPEVQDGVWERVETTDGWRLRPAPGFEGYDRVVLVSPPIAGPRRVTVDVTFHGNTGRLFGFGVIPLWGGHNDPEPISPRRGWEYGIAWYYAPSKGFGVEFSRKEGAEPHDTIRAYEAAGIEAGETYRIVAEAHEMTGGLQNRPRYDLRMRWSRLPSGQMSDWIELGEEGGLLGANGHAVALVAHRAAVEFGSVLIERLPTQ